MANICNFCLKISNDCKSVDETLKETIQLIFINVEIVITEDSLICMECIQRLQLAFDLKAANICNEDLIASYETIKPRHEKLTDFYLEKNEMEPNVFPYELKICRFCITVVTESNYLLEDTDNINVWEIIRKHIPEVDLTITNNPILCKTCMKKLQDYVMFINSWLDVYNLKKSYCYCNNKTENPDLSEVRKFMFETNIGPQHSDNYKIFNNNIKNENIIKMFKIGEEGSAKNSHCFVDNIDLKDDIEIHESKLEYTAEGVQIKTEIVCSDSQLRNDDLTMEYNFEMEESKLKTEILQSQTKIESDDYFLKDHEISVSDVMDAVDSTEVEEYSERISDTRSLCNNKGIGQQKSNEYSSLSEHGVPIEISSDSKVGSSFFGKSSSKMEKNRPSLTNNSVTPLMASRNNAYHNLIVHAGKNDFYNCEHCDFKTNYKNSLKTHLMVHFDQNVFYKCEHCDYKTIYKCNLKSHLIIHSNENVFHKCLHCDFKTKYKYSLKSHLIMHSNENILYKCEHCDYKTKRKGDLKSHLIIHSDENIFHKCVHCDYKTKYRNNLNGHLKVHSIENVFYTCEYCDFKTKYKQSLKKHLIVHSDENVLHKCNECDFKTKRKNTLNKHLMVHSGQ